MRTKIRAELTSGEGCAARGEGQREGGIDFDGYEVHPGFFDDVAQIDLLKAPPACRGPALILQLSHRTEASAESQQFAAALGGQARLECLRLEPFWDKLDDVDTGQVEEIVRGWIAGL